MGLTPHTYESSSYLNRMIELRDNVIDSCEYVINYYLSNNILLPGNVKGIEAFYKELLNTDNRNSDQEELLKHLQVSKVYFRTVSLHLYLQTR